MKAFWFRLETVARIRVLEERVAREHFVIDLRKLRVAEVEQHYAEVAIQSFKTRSGVMTSGQYAWNEMQARRLGESHENSVQRLAQARSACSDSRSTWQAASKRASVIDRLKENSRRRWREEISKEEIKDLDDLTNSRYLMGRQ